jgi:signal transduction histidine kinase
MREEAARQQVLLNFDAAEHVIGVWDRSRLDQIVTNLVTNAIKYGPGKPVQVAVSRDVESAELRVRDHGIGIPAEQQERIFGKFERAASQRNYGGLGLGLWITRELVELMHGSVRVESTEGEGATFIVSLPLKQESDASAA